MNAYEENMKTMMDSMLLHFKKKMFLVLTKFNDGTYLTFKSIFHKALIYFSTIVISRSYPFLEPTSTKE